ncbi:MAG TPA: apolipoprotein N-acyltransferase [Terriglobia bacterium]|nr:apolipoprotein N-acyltransferase [Terriglobia bacterium]
MTIGNFPFSTWFRKPLARYAASVLSGLLLFACFPTLDWAVLVWVACLPLLLAVVIENRWVHGFWFGYLAGAVFLAGSCYWFVTVMQGYGNLNPAVAAGVLVLFVILFSTFYGVFGLFETVVARRSISAALILSPFLWVAMELARTYLVTGFPWNLLGYAIRPVGLQQVASITAVYGLSFLAVSTSALAVWALLEPGRTVRWAALAVWVVLLVAGNWALQPPHPQPEPNVALLVQPDIPLGEAAMESWVPWTNPAPLESLVEDSVEAVRESGGTPDVPPLLVWPESSAPFLYTRDPIFRDAIQSMAKQAHAYVISGTVTFAGQGNSRPQNAAVLLSPEGQLLLHYVKIHLVPFGEYVPWWAFPGKVGKITAQVGDFVPGKSVEVARTPEGVIGIFICYETIFPQLVRRFAAHGAGVLVNISDDGWYGDSSAPFQHFEMARFRAIENGRFVLRGTNNGITAIIDPYGRIRKEIPRNQRGILTGHFRYLSKKTFYTEYGDVFAWLCVAVAAAIVLLLMMPRFRPGRNAGIQRNFRSNCD